MRICYVPSDMDAPGCYRCLFQGRQIGMKTDHEVVMPPKTFEPGKDGKERWNFKVGFFPPQPWAHLWVIQSRFDRIWAESGIDNLRSFGIATVADVDDAYEQIPEWNPAFYGTHPYIRDDGLIINRKERRKIKRNTGYKPEPNQANSVHMKTIFSQVEAMTVSTPFIKDTYKHLNQNIHVVRNYVDWDMWEDIQPQYEVLRPDNRVRIGYQGVFRYRKGDLEVIKPWIRDFMLAHPNVDFVSNAQTVQDFLEIPLGQQIVVGEYDFLDIKTMAYQMPSRTATMDIGLVPLADNDLAKSKSHLKGMEYNSAGIPYIATDTESYRYFTESAPRRNGIIAEDPEHWQHLLHQMVVDDEWRRQLGENARYNVKDHHTIQDNWMKWLDVYEGVMGDKYTALARGAITRGAVQKISELSNMLRLADQQPLNTVVEVGSAKGGTFWALAQLAADDALMASIDIPGGSPIDVRNGQDVYGDRDRERFRRLVKETQRCRLIDADSQKLSTMEMLADTLGPRKIDLLFIDADHRLDGVTRDFNLYSPLVKEGGLIVFHDMIPQNDPRSGVHVLWQKLKKRYTNTWEFIGKDAWGQGHWGGIGVIRV